MKYSIYIADDEKNIRDLIKDFLESDGYIVKAFPTGDILMETFLKYPCDLIILDIMMPGTDGLTLCQNLRKITTIPIILLTAKDTEIDYVRGITIGSDDYITKPFRPTMLLMKVRSLLRRIEMDNKTQKSDIDVSFGDLIYSTKKNAVFKNKIQVELTQTELRLLSYMLQNNDKSFSRDELLETVWGYDSAVETRVTDETLRRIRKKLLFVKSGVKIRTIWGYGYKLEFEESDNIDKD